jgi:hypothetical protein
LDKAIARILDVLYMNSPGEPDWSAVREAIFTAGVSPSLIIEILRVLWLYAEDPSAFEEYLLSIKE